MPSLTIKNIVDDLQEALLENAACFRRSLNNEALLYVEKFFRNRWVFPLFF